METNLLSLKGLYAGYDQLKILHEVDMIVKPNEIIAIIGPNGAGKSTILKSIFSIAHKTAGTIIFDDQDITQCDTHELIRRGICYVPQGRINFGEMTVLDNLLVALELVGGSKDLLGSVFAQFPVLREKKHLLAYALSGGEQQQLAIGRALLFKPKLLLLDEPSLGLSPKLQHELFDLITSLKSDNMSIMLVEQNANKAIAIANRTYLLEQGRVVLSGGDDILKDARIKNVYLGGQ